MKLELDQLIGSSKKCQIINWNQVEIKNGLVVFGKYDFDSLREALSRGNQVIQILHASAEEKEDLNQLAIRYPDLDLLKSSRVTVICDDFYQEVYQGLLKDKSPEKLMMQPTQENIASMVILLMRDLNRVSHVHQKLTTTLTNLRIFPAIDALTPHAIDDGVQTHKLAILKPIRAGRIGCLFSHLSLWKDLLGSKSKPAMMILEDDNVLVEGFVEKFGAVLKEVPTTFDLVHLYRGDEDSLGGEEQENSSLLEKGVALQQTCAYLISRRGAFRLVNAIKSIKEPLDVILKKQVESGLLEGYAVRETLLRNVGDADGEATEDEQLESNTSNSQMYVPTE